MGDLEDWAEVVSSDEEKPAKSSSSKKQQVKKSKVSKEQKDDARKVNNPLIGAAKKVVRALESVIKESKKANKSAYGSAQLKEETEAAQTLLKEAQQILKKGNDYTNAGKKLDAYDPDMTTVKELAKVIKEKCSSIGQVDHVLKGLDDDALGKLKAVVETRQRAADVS